jgi:hypothetical protein
MGIAWKRKSKVGRPDQINIRLNLLTHNDNSGRTGFNDAFSGPHFAKAAAPDFSIRI